MTRRTRRHFLADVAATGAAVLLAGCDRSSSSVSLTGGFIGQSVERGHRFRDQDARVTPASTHRTAVAIVGGGIAGLAAARALRQSGVEDFRLFELEDEPGGNSRGGRIAGFQCPLGAHYLPVPGPYAQDVAALLDEFGVRRMVDGAPRYDELMQCFSLQERLWIDGAWQDGVLPVAGQPASTIEQYRRFSALVRESGRPQAFTIPTAASRWDDTLQALDAITFATWLDRNRLDAPALRWYLDYCCRDDYGADASVVSAWAGLHYFASRHGFAAPPDEADGEPVLTWPEGNAWLTRRLASPLEERIQCGRVALRATQDRDGASVDLLDVRSGAVERWNCRHLILAVPLFIARRLLASPPDALIAADTQVAHAPWLVANLHIDSALRRKVHDVPLAWDNVLYGTKGLGYIDAAHQDLRSVDGATVLTWYRPLGDAPAEGRRSLLARRWEDWAEDVFVELGTAHPDLRERTLRIELMRYGHAMAIPTPGTRSSPALARLAERPLDRVSLAHADLSAYSIFEEALHHGLRAGRQAARAL